MEAKTNKIVIASVVFIMVLTAAFFGTTKMRAYSSAQKAVDRGDYSSAVTILEGLKGYKDSDALLDKSYYGLAEKYCSDGQYEEALTVLIGIPEVEGSADLAIKCKYEQAKVLMNDGDYSKAHDYLNTIPDYQDASSLDKECMHMMAVQSDAEPPVISGLDENVSVRCGTEFNIKDYVDENIVITDNVTENITEYSITCDTDSKLYETGIGRIKTNKIDKLDFTVTAKDEAGNAGTKKIIVSLEPVHVTAEDPNPVIYDGEYAAISLQSFDHGTFFGKSEYRFIFEVTNKMDTNIEVYLPYTTSINDYQVSASYIMTSIAPGKTGTMETSIYDDDIPDSIGDYDTIESEVCIKRLEDDRAFYSIPIVIDVDAVN